MQHEGRLDFRDGDPDYEQIKLASARVPTVVTIYLDRPAILTNVRDKVHAIVANFGVSDENLWEVLVDPSRAEGRLPFELPSSMADVEAQSPGLPHDTRQPLYRLGAGRSRAGSARRWAVWTQGHSRADSGPAKVVPGFGLRCASARLAVPWRRRLARPVRVRAGLKPCAHFRITWASGSVGEVNPAIAMADDRAPSTSSP